MLDIRLALDPQTGERTITDVRCMRGPDTSLNPAARGATIESLRCELEDLGD